MGERLNVKPVFLDHNKLKGLKARKDKLHDVKIPLTEALNLMLVRESYKRWNGSKTKVATELFLFGLNNIITYPEVPYTGEGYCAHVKIDHETYKRTSELAVEWRCSMRKAVHRVFVESVKKKQLGGIL